MCLGIRSPEAAGPTASLRPQTATAIAQAPHVNGHQGVFPAATRLVDYGDDDDDSDGEGKDGNQSAGSRDPPVDSTSSVIAAAVVSGALGDESEEAADLRARLMRAEASLRITESSRDELARQQGQYRGLIAKVGGLNWDRKILKHYCRLQAVAFNGKAGHHQSRMSRTLHEWPSFSM